MEYYTPLINSLHLDQSHSLHLFDLEGHGLSPTSALSTLSISSFGSDVHGVYEYAKISGGSTLVAHSMGCLVALSFVLQYPDLVKNLILIGPPPNPLPPAASANAHARAALVREKGMMGVVDAVVTAGTSERTKAQHPVGLTAARLSLLSQDPEGYAKACSALAGATIAFDLGNVQARTLIITGEEDKVSPPALCEKMKSAMPACEDVVVLKDVGHWHLFEDAAGVSAAVNKFLKG